MKRFTQMFLISLVVLLAVSCDNAWDEHYYNKNGVNRSELLRLGDYIKSNPDWSVFATMLQKTGYDKVLNNSHTFTVWVPVNSSFVDIDMTDTDLLKQIVESHISNQFITTSQLSSERVYTLGKKYNKFEVAESGYTFGTKKLKSVDILANNGIVHEMESYVPYIPNIWQYIEARKTTGLDSLYSYFLSQFNAVFSPTASTAVDRDSLGNIIYSDSIFDTRNFIFDLRGNIDEEDSVYTLILPNNTAWTTTYDRLAQYFVFPNDDNGSKQAAYTKFWLINDIFFRGEYESPELLDSIQSTSSNVLHNPMELFGNSEKTVVSNGAVYVSNSLGVDENETWFQPIKVEAESESGILVKNMAKFSKTNYGSELPISRNRYLLLQLEGNTLTKPSVTFDIPKVYSRKYNIYCVFLPESVENISFNRSSKVTFTLSYIKDETGKIGTLNVKPAGMLTDSVGITKMLVTEFEFPYAYIPETFYNVASPITLKIQNDVTTKNKDPKLTSDLRIDYIILEPVVE